VKATSPKKTSNWPKSHERMLALAIREVQVETIGNHHLTTIKIASINGRKEGKGEGGWKEGRKEGAPVAHACNLSYSGGRDQEDCDSKSLGNSL
jgi:hypothetical protein